MSFTNAERRLLRAHDHVVDQQEPGGVLDRLDRQVRQRRHSTSAYGQIGTLTRPAVIDLLAQGCTRAEIAERAGAGVSAVAVTSFLKRHGLRRRVIDQVVIVEKHRWRRP